MPPSYGLRPDGSQKGQGYFGPIPMTDGSGGVMTEKTVGVNMGGEETDIPAIVPTLSAKEIEHLQSGGKPTESIMRKAVEHAFERKKKGLSVYND